MCPTQRLAASHSGIEPSSMQRGDSEGGRDPQAHILGQAFANYIES